MNGYDDFLGLSDRDFARERTIVFYGRSGSGKSAAISFLLNEHPSFAGRTACHVPRPETGGRWLAPPDADTHSVLVIDEIRKAGELLSLNGLASPKRTMLIATHVHPAMVRVARFRSRTSVFVTDRGSEKIARYLKRIGVSASNEAVEAYVRRFGGTFTDVDIILERYPSDDFDRALSQFFRFCRIA